MKNVYTSSYLKDNIATVVKTLPEEADPMFITHNGEIKLVVEDFGNYQKTQDPLAMLKLLNLRERERQSGAYEELDAVIEDLLNED